METTGKVSIIKLVQEGESKELAALLDGSDSSAYLKEVDSNRYTALHWAAHCDEIGMLKQLLDAKADPYAVTKRSETYLHRASARNSLRIVRAIRSGQIQNSKNLIDCKNEWGETAMHLAAAAGFVDVIKELVHAKASVDASDKWGRSPLKVASESGESSAVSCLESLGAKLEPKAEATTLPLSIPQPPPMFPKSLPSVPVSAKSNVPNGKPKATMRSLFTDEFKKRAARMAKQRKSREKKQQKSVLKNVESAKKRKPTFKPLVNGSPPALSKLVEYPGDVEAVKRLLKEKKANPTGKDMYGLTALHKFASWDKVDLVEAILPYLSKEDINSQRSSDGSTCLHLAISMGAKRTLNKLLNNPLVDIDVKNKKGESAWDLAKATCVRNLGSNQAISESKSVDQRKEILIFMSKTSNG
mmetsp:Transcript_2025/g.2890  ORF Transcript_2025/g.2890 Transcript_2025/m.2890 type:complete len:415 (+) Transcript_2025:27-1271(+)